jgi:hypothetical protein
MEVLVSIEPVYCQFGLSYIAQEPHVLMFQTPHIRCSLVPTICANLFLPCQHDDYTSYLEVPSPTLIISKFYSQHFVCFEPFLSLPFAKQERPNVLETTRGDNKKDQKAKSNSVPQQQALMQYEQGDLESMAKEAAAMANAWSSFLEGSE